MNNATLRGFDFLAVDLKDRLRFCNPLLSFGDRDSATIYVVRHLEWSYDGEDKYRSLAQLSPELMTSFATPVIDKSVSIHPGEGVIVMGEGFVAAAEEAGISIDSGQAPAFIDSDELHCRIGIAKIETYEQFTDGLVQAARAVLDAEIWRVAKSGLSGQGRAALRVLRYSTRSISVLAKYELMVAYATGEKTTYQRLLERFSIELNEDRKKLDRDTRALIPLEDDRVNAGHRGVVRT